MNYDKKLSLSPCGVQTLLKGSVGSPGQQKEESEEGERSVQSYLNRMCNIVSFLYSIYNGIQYLVSLGGPSGTALID